MSVTALEMPVLIRHGREFVFQGTEIYWMAQGVSWGGVTTKRDGKAVTCGHRHKNQTTAERCAKVMRRERPGKCQQYRTAEIHRVKYKSAVPA